MNKSTYKSSSSSSRSRDGPLRSSMTSSNLGSPYCRQRPSISVLDVVEPRAAWATRGPRPGGWLYTWLYKYTDWIKQMITDQDRVAANKTSSSATSRCAGKDHFPSWTLHMCSGEDHRGKPECFWSRTLLSAEIRLAQSLAKYTWLQTWPALGASLQHCYMLFAKLHCETSRSFAILFNRQIQQSNIWSINQFFSTYKEWACTLSYLRRRRWSFRSYRK